ncbi:MAG: hypothetical protein ACLFU8_00665 [Anaerolineales bacterium]
MARFTYIPVASGLHTEETLSRLIEAYVPALATLGGKRMSPAELGGELPQLIFVVTGGTEQRALEIQEHRRTRRPDEPVYLLAHPGHNSLPAALETLARLREAGIPGRILYLPGPRDPAALQRLDDAVSDLEVQRALQAARIGLVGAPSDWLVASRPDAQTVREVWGPEVLPLSLDELYEALEGVADTEIGEPLRDLRKGAREKGEPSQQEIAEVVRVYLALRKVVKRYALAAVSVRCFDLVLKLSTTGCFALAQLNDEGIIAGCEGDVVSTLGMLWVHELLHRLPWMANPSRLNETENTLWLGHCTVPRTLVGDYTLRSHFESGLGVGIQGTLPPGPITLLRMGGRDLRQLWLAEGVLLKSGDAEDLCRTQAQVRLEDRSVVDLLHNPLGNHLLLVPGNHTERLRSWWETFINRE